jgi:hypothetical protein
MKLQALKNKIKELEEEVERLEQPEGVWETKLGKCYIYNDGAGRRITKTHNSDAISRAHIANHNVYETYEIAEKASILQRRANLIIQACLNFDPDFEPAWADDQRKYVFYYDHNKGDWRYRWTWTLADSIAYVSTLAIADKVVAYLNSQEIK